ncbi:type III pantothenate kinase [Polaribacter sp. R77954]|uniref:type III pantothenate kinase n=1 Tax=Polaribacter sp. R77954 TaxID=3093870 RepID=UPI0037C8FBA0
MNLIIDVGNTKVKVAVFEENKMVFRHVFDKKNIILEFKKIITKYKIEQAIISSVASIPTKILEKIASVVPLTCVSSKMKLPFKNLYSTPDTLGVDRIVLVFAAVVKYPNQNTLIIDSGTCITYDFVSKQRNYFGGAIAPGIEMRYKALHQFTSKLPMLQVKKPHNFTGDSTFESMHSGVVNGVIQEINGVIEQYKNKYLDLTVVLTGGDANFLSKQLKSSIFANQNFLLEGLNEILIFNKSE